MEKHEIVNLMHRMRYIVEMPDSSQYSVPVLTIAYSRAHYYAHEFGGSWLRSFREDTAPLFAQDHYEIKDWAANNMNWSDVVHDAELIPNTGQTDFQEGWINGHKEIVVDEK